MSLTLLRCPWGWCDTAGKAAACPHPAPTWFPALPWCEARVLRPLVCTWEAGFSVVTAAIREWPVNAGSSSDHPSTLCCLSNQAIYTSGVWNADAAAASLPDTQSWAAYTPGPSDWVWIPAPLSMAVPCYCAGWEAAGRPTHSLKSCWPSRWPRLELP